MLLLSFGAGALSILLLRIEGGFRGKVWYQNVPQLRAGVAFRTASVRSFALKPINEEAGSSYDRSRATGARSRKFDCTITSKEQRSAPYLKEMPGGCLLPTAEEKQGRSAQTRERERGRLRNNADGERRHPNGVQAVDRWVGIADEGNVEQRRPA